MNKELKNEFKKAFKEVLVKVVSVGVFLFCYWLILFAWVRGIIFVSVADKDMQHTVNTIGLCVVGFLLWKAFSFFAEKFNH